MHLGMKIIIFQRFDLASVSCARRVVCQTEELLRRGHSVWLTDYPHAERREAIPELVNLSHLGATLIPRAADFRFSPQHGHPEASAAAPD